LLCTERADLFVLWAAMASNSTANRKARGGRKNGSRGAVAKATAEAVTLPPAEPAVPAVAVDRTDADEREEGLAVAAFASTASEEESKLMLWKTWNTPPLSRANSTRSELFFPLVETRSPDEFRGRPVVPEVRVSPADFRSISAVGWAAMHGRFVAPAPKLSPVAPASTSAVAVTDCSWSKRLQEHTGPIVSRSKQVAVGLTTSARQMVSEPSFQAAGVTGAGAAVVLGTGGGAAGLVGGSAVGAALGVLPAIFTFGLSIPVTAAAVGAAGCIAGAVVGSSVGLVGGSVAGYGAYTKRIQIREAATGAWEKAEGSKEVLKAGLVRSTDFVKGRLLGSKKALEGGA